MFELETITLQLAKVVTWSPIKNIQGLADTNLRGVTDIQDLMSKYPSFSKGLPITLKNNVTMRLLSQNFKNEIDEVATQVASKRLGNVLGVGVSGILSVGFQAANDFGNPYLTGRQKLRRAGISGLLGSGAAGIGLGIEFLAVGSAGGPIGLIVAIPLAIIFDMWVAPEAFQFFGLIQTRELAPLYLSN